MKKAKTKSIKVPDAAVQEEVVEPNVSKVLCSATDCWHYGVCLYTDAGWEHPPTTPPELNSETKKPKCFLAMDWYRPKIKKAGPSLEELEKAKKEAKKRKKEKENDIE